MELLCRAPGCDNDRVTGHYGFCSNECRTARRLACRADEEQLGDAARHLGEEVSDPLFGAESANITYADATSDMPGTERDETGQSRAAPTAGGAELDMSLYALGTGPTTNSAGGTGTGDTGNEDEDEDGGEDENEGEDEDNDEDEDEEEDDDEDEDEDEDDEDEEEEEEHDTSSSEEDSPNADLR